MNYLKNRRLRWQIPLKLWLIYCFALTLVFGSISWLSTIAAVKKYGISIEANPVTRMSFENFGPAPGLVIVEITGFAVLAIILFWLYKHRAPFLSLFVAHSILIMFFLTSLNDFSSVAPGKIGKILSPVQIFGIYPFDILVFLSLGFIATLLVTKEAR